MAASDDEDKELAAAIALSLDRSEEACKQAISCVPATPLGGLAGLNRSAMEQERLARQAARKRQRSESPPGLSSPRKALRMTEKTTEMASGARLKTFSSIVHLDQSSRKTEVANAANQQLRASKVVSTPDTGCSVNLDPRATLSLAFPAGVVKSTWAFGHERTGYDIKLEEVLEAATLQTAVLSAFQWNVDWVLSKLKVPPKGGITKCIFVMQGKDATMREQMMNETEEMRSYLRLCFPPMQGQTWCMHSKLMLLFHSTKLRIAVPTANLLNFDWGETGQMENSVFIIDLPRYSDDAKKPAELTGFGEDLLHFVEKQGLEQDVRDGLLNFDFKATTGMAFVHSVGGISTDADISMTGLPGLARAVRNLGLETDTLQIDYAASSIGSLNDDFLRNVHRAAQGQDMVERAKAAGKVAKATFFSPPSARTSTDMSSIRNDVRLYFPTSETVRSSTARAAGTICLTRKWYEDMPFPRACFRDYVSTRPGLLSHNKIMYARGKRLKTLPAADVAWAYVGSSNMSESAWGKLAFDKKLKAWKLNCRNWECGVLLPVKPMTGNRKPRKQYNADDSETESEDDTDADDTIDPDKMVEMDVFDAIVRPPFRMPGATYGDREPWYFNERRQPKPVEDFVV